MTEPADQTIGPLVSVIIPAYNAESYLRDAIDSALAQTYKNLEVIVVNDGSTDGTAAVGRSCGPRVRVVDQENRGPAGARNTGFAAAAGNIIALLDADDLWMPGRIQACVDLLQSDPRLGFVTTDAFLIEGDTPTKLRYYGNYQRFPFPSSGAQLDEIAKRNFVFVSVVFDRRLFELVGAQLDERLWGTEDYDLWTRFLLAGAQAGLVPEPLAWYRVRTDSVSRSRRRQWRAHLTVLERHLPSLWVRGAHGRPQDAYDIGIDIARRGDRRTALRYLTRAVREPGATAASRFRYLLGGTWALIAGPHAAPTREPA